MSDAVGTTRGIAPGPVTDWLVAHVPGLRPPFAFALIAGGHSNLTYRVTDATGRKLVLRRPPLGAVLATAHDMGREHRIIAALAGTGVPVPPALGLCSDPAVNDAPFYVMDFVEGVVLDVGSTVESHFREAERRGLGQHVIEVLARLHEVDVDAVGLGDLGRREGYVPRQLKRWRTQWEQSKTRELPAMEEVYEALQSGIPPQAGACVVHGDYRLGNMLTSREARIAAVLDWELCTLGDPLADLGYLMNNWAEPGESGPESRGAALAPTSVGGFPTRAEMLADYTARTGRDVSRIDYYRAFSYWRLAAIVEGVLARYLKGVMGNAANTDAFRAQVDALAGAALERVRALGA
jgi:aminoglycoside phosphotransferase (APT) family kinase protein